MQRYMLFFNKNGFTHINSNITSPGGHRDILYMFRDTQPYRSSHHNSFEDRLTVY